MKRHNHPVRDGEYKITFDPVEKKWQEVFLAEGNVLKEMKNLLFWHKESSSEVYVEDMETRTILGTLDCASELFRTVILKDDEYIVIRVDGICEVFSAANYERKNTKELAERRNSTLASLDDLFA